MFVFCKKTLSFYSFTTKILTQNLQQDYWINSNTNKTHTTFTTYAGPPASLPYLMYAAAA